MDEDQTRIQSEDQSIAGVSDSTLSQPGEALPPACEQDTVHGWDGKHFINIRISIPLIFMRVYVTLVAGKERRSTARRRAEREKHPLGTLSNAFVFTPMRFPVSTSEWARAHACSYVFMNAPDPNLTSRTRASRPSAIFLLMMLAVIRGMDATVAVTSRRA